MDKYSYEKDIRTEKLGGRIVYMSPSPMVNHHEVSTTLHFIFKQYLKGKKCRAFGDGVDVFLTPDDRVIPDMMIVCNPDIIKSTGIYGTPDFIVEVLSPSTAKNDRGYKKDLYERCGVKEYWIIDPVSKSIEIYLLKDGKYYVDNVYGVYDDEVFELMTEKEKSEYVTEFKTSLYDDLTINIYEVFENLI